MTQTTISTKVQKLVADFAALSTWEEKYARIIEMGKALPPLEESLRTDQNKVRGCQSQVWLSARAEGGKIYFSADSDATIVKGLIALILHVYSGHTPGEILSQKPDFIQDIGLNTNLSQARSNGLVSMIKQIMFYALAFQTIAE